MREALWYAWLSGASLVGVSVLGILPSYIEWLVKVLAVVGAAAICGGLVGFVVRRLGRWLTFREVPRRAVMLFRALGAVAGGLAVWTMVFSPGGSGLFGGGGDLFGGKGVATGKTPENSAASTPEPAASIVPVADKRSTLRIVLLGGPRVAADRFYQIEGQAQPLNLVEVKKLLKAQVGLHNIELMIYENSVARNHSAVRELEKWAEQNELAVTKLPSKGEIP